MNIQMPPLVVEIFYGFTISNYDFLPFGEIFEKLNLEDNTNPFTDNFENMDFESSLVISNLPDIVVLAFIFITYSSLLFCLEFLIRNFGSIFGETISSYILKAADMYRWGVLILFIKETYLPLMLMIGINMLNTSMLTRSTFELINLVISLFLGISYLCFFGFAIFFTFKLYPKHYS